MWYGQEVARALELCGKHERIAYNGLGVKARCLGQEISWIAWCLTTMRRPLAYDSLDPEAHGIYLEIFEMSLHLALLCKKCKVKYLPERLCEPPKWRGKILLEAAIPIGL